MRSPHRGLCPLEAEDAGIFFGRDGPIVKALDRLSNSLRETMSCLQDVAPEVYCWHG